MNRSLPNVILGGFGTSGTGGGEAMAITGTATVWEVDETVKAIADARNIDRTWIRSGCCQGPVPCC